MYNKTFYNILHSRRSRGKSTALKQMFYFTCIHLLSSTCVQHAKTFTKNVFATFLQTFCRKTFAKHFRGGYV